jgi:ankyrin repeat protein/serine/threonine protein kinase
MAETRPGLSSIPEDEQGSSIRTDFKSNIDVLGAWRDSNNRTSHDSDPRAPVPWRDSDGSVLEASNLPDAPSVESLPFRRLRKFFGLSETPKSTHDSRDRGPSTYGSARASNVSASSGAPSVDNFRPRSPRRSSSFFGEPTNTGNLQDSEVSVYWSAHASNTSSHYVSALGSNITDFERLSSTGVGSRFHPAASEDSEYKKLMKEKRMILPVLEELNWAGRLPGSGQHVEFGATEKPPLEEICLLGQSLNAEVHKVKCRRILLARKRMTCGPRFTLKDAILEVEHLQRLRHSHIIQLVGSYTKGRTFSILMYPVADYELSQFMAKVEDIIASDVTEIQDYMAVVSLGRFFACLTSAVAYIHENTTAHMDIKPRNILVKQHPRYQFGHRVYIADFGISRHFSPLDHSQTDRAISFTRKYCAPEVFDQDLHGRPADIFSLGCVFLEMHTVLCRRTLDEFATYRSQDSGTEAFHANLPRVTEWVDQLSMTDPFIVLEPTSLRSFPLPKEHRNNRLISSIKRMLNWNISQRPRAHRHFQELYFETGACCGSGLETFEADEQDDKRNILQGANSDDSDVNNPGTSYWSYTRNIDLNMAVLIATSNGNQGILHQLLPLMDGLDSSMHPRGMTPLHCAAGEGDAKIVQLLVDYGASARIKDIWYDLAVHYATRNGHAEIVDQLLTRTLPLPQDCPKLLEMASRLGQDQVVEILLKQPMTISISLGSREVALAEAARNCDSKVVKILLQDSEANGIRDKIMKGAFLAVVSDSSSMGIVTLLSHGAPMEDDLDDDYNPLLVAVSAHSVSVVKILLKKGSYANPGTRARSLTKALHQAIVPSDSGRESLYLIDVLLRGGASLECQDSRGRTPLHNAARYACLSVLQLLLDQGANFRATDVDGLTPLHVIGTAFESFDNDLLSKATLLLERGADMEARTLRGEMVLHLAASSCNEPLVDLLLDKGANSAAEDSDGWTPEDVCCKLPWMRLQAGPTREVFKRHRRMLSGDSSKSENETA